MNHAATIHSPTRLSKDDVLTVNSLGRRMTVPIKEVTAMSLQRGQSVETTRLTIVMFGTILIDVLAPDASVAFRSLKTVGVREVPSMSGHPADQ